MRMGFRRCKGSCQGGWVLKRTHIIKIWNCKTKEQQAICAEHYGYKP